MKTSNRLIRPGNLVAAVLLAAVAVWLAVNLIQAPGQFGSVVLIGITNGAIYGLLALGYSLVYGILQLFNFPQGDIFTFGAMVGISIAVALLGADGSGSVLAVAGVLLLVLLAACVVGMVLNGAIELLVYRPMRRRQATRIQPMIASLGCVYLLQNVISVIWGPDFRAIPPVFPRGKIFEIAGIAPRWNDLLVIAVTVPTLLVLRWFIQRTKRGRALRAVAEDGDAAATVGIDPGRLILTAYVIGGLLAGIGVLLYLSQYGTVRYESGFLLGLFAFTAAILGGMGNLTGAVAGGLTIGLVQAANEGFSWMTPGPSWSQAIIFGILVIILTLRPQGLLGQRGSGAGWMTSAAAAGRPAQRRRLGRLAGRLPAIRTQRADGTLRGGPPPSFLLVGIGLVAVALYPFYVNSLPASVPVISSFPSMATMCIMAIFALMAVGLNIVVGYAGLLDLGYVAFYASGAYVMGWLASAHFSGADFHAGALGPAAELAGVHVSPWLVVLFAGLVTAALGAAIGFPTLRMRGDYLAIVTFGFGEIIPVLILNAGSVTNGSFGISGIDSPGLGTTLGGALGTTSTFRESLQAADYFYWGALALLVLGAVTSVNLRGSRIGRAWIAVREDEDAAAAIGVPLMRVKTYAYAGGAFLGGVAGAYYASFKGTAFPSDFSFSISFLILIMVVLGGSGSVVGVAIAGGLLAWLDQEGLAGLGSWLSTTAGVNLDVTRYQLGFFGLLLIVIMVFRPQGLIPERRHTMERRERQAAGAEG
jgi:branched-chain amino acid transport system permease protein